jgi:hypothetical protein
VSPNGRPEQRPGRPFGLTSFLFRSSRQATNAEYRYGSFSLGVEATSMETDAQDQLASAQAELIRDRATFERQTARVLDQLAAEKLELGKLSHRLLADRARLVLLGRRLRKRWRATRKSFDRDLSKREKSLMDTSIKVHEEALKNQKERAQLQDVRDQLKKQRAIVANQAGNLAALSRALGKERAEIIAYRSRLEAERLSWRELGQQREDEMFELERRIEMLRREVRDMESRKAALEISPQYPLTSLPKVA